MQSPRIFLRVRKGRLIRTLKKFTTTRQNIQVIFYIDYFVIYVEYCKILWYSIYKALSVMRQAVLPSEYLMPDTSHMNNQLQPLIL
jgi:hypothetical protein